MSKNLSVPDRLRVERVVWAVDTYIQGLPGRSRRAIRRELRTNLRASAADVGASAAIKSLGSLRRLAVGYLEAEYGEGRPRAELLKGVTWASMAGIVMLVALFVGFDSFVAGLEASGSGPGTYRWDEARLFGLTAEVTVDGVGDTRFALSVSYLYFLYPALAGLIGARLWRLLPIWWRRIARDRATRRANAHT